MTRFKSAGAPGAVGASARGAGLGLVVGLGAVEFDAGDGALLFNEDFPVALLFEDFLRTLQSFRDSFLIGFDRFNPGFQVIGSFHADTAFESFASSSLIHLRAYLIGI